MMRSMALLFACLVLAPSCQGTTGFALVQFNAAARGFSGAVKDQPFVFDAPGGVRVTLTQASLHVGAMYLTQSIPQPGGGATACVPQQTYEGAFVGEVRGEGDIDLLDPSLQDLHLVGDGSTLPARAGQVWLVHDEAIQQGNLNQADTVPVLSLQGAYESNGAAHTFSAGIAIDKSRIQAANTALPGEIQICEKRIVSGIPAALTLSQAGTLVLQVDAAALFEGVPFTDLPDASTLAGPAAGCSPDRQTERCFTNDDGNLSSRALFANLTSRGPYRFAWLPAAHPGTVGGNLDAASEGACVSVGAQSGSATGFALRAAPCVDRRMLGPGQLLLTASGENLALEGYTFPDPNGTFADGWQIAFSHVIATFDKVSLWTNPDRVPTDQSQHGPLVAEADGPWAIDMHLNGGAFPYVDGKESGERAIAFAVIANQNKNGGAAFPTDGTRFAVGFSAVEPTPNALNVNLDADGLDAYKSMIDHQCTVYYRGIATWVGNTNGGTCVVPSDGGVVESTGTGNEAEFANIPTTVAFDFCVKPAELGGLQPGQPETSYVNCDNQDNDPATPLNGEPHPRGVAFPSNRYAVGEVTFHTDHPFWESTKHDTPPRFDPFAAQAVALTDGGVPTVHFEDVRGVNYLAFTDRQGNALPWRTCDPSYQDPNGGSRIGPMHFDPVLVPSCTNGDHATGLCDFYDFSKYNQSTQGHYNGADGLCYVQRRYLSPE